MSDKRIKIVELLSHGFKSKEIADKLEISHRTVEKHLEIMRLAYGCKSSIQLVAKFIREKIIE